MAKWAENAWANQTANTDYSQALQSQQAVNTQYFEVTELQPIRPADPPSVKLTYARNAENGLSFYANGLPVGAIANRDLVRLIQQAAELLQAEKVAE
jgi:hypothetical protein